jgi:proteasome assembly chaperone (PAC2) family protein
MASASGRTALEVKQLRSPNAERVNLVAALPDMGSVGGLVAEFLVDHLKIEPFAEISSYDKPFVLCNDGLIHEVPSVFKVYYSERASLVVMTGNSQPNETKELYELCERVLDLAAAVGRIGRVYTCGGYHREKIVGEPRVYGVSNNPKLFKELDKLGIREIGAEVSSITWFNGVILGVAKRRKIDAVGLYGELTDPAIPQPDSARAVLRALTTLLSLPQIERRELGEGGQAEGI